MQVQFSWSAQLLPKIDLSSKLNHHSKVKLVQIPDIHGISFLHRHMSTKTNMLLLQIFPNANKGERIVWGEILLNLFSETFFSLYVLNSPFQKSIFS